jgi:hypothetical protein
MGYFMGFHFASSNSTKNPAPVFVTFTRLRLTNVCMTPRLKFILLDTLRFKDTQIL